MLHVDVRDMGFGGDASREAEQHLLHRQLRFMWQLAGDNAVTVAAAVSQTVASQVQAQLPCFQATAVHAWLLNHFS